MYNLLFLGSLFSFSSSFDYYAVAEGAADDEREKKKRRFLFVCVNS